MNRKREGLLNINTSPAETGNPTHTCRSVSCNLLINPDHRIIHVFNVMSDFIKVFFCFIFGIFVCLASLLGKICV